MTRSPFVAVGLALAMSPLSAHADRAPVPEGKLALGQVETGPCERDGKAMVTVAFTNFDNTSLLTLSLVREGDGWKVDDIASLGEGENWLLSWLLQYDPFAIR